MNVPALVAQMLSVAINLHVRGMIKNYVDFPDNLITDKRTYPSVF